MLADNNTSSSAPTPQEDAVSVRSTGSSTPGQNVEMFDLAELTDNLSVASYGEAAAVSQAASNTSESSHMSTNLLKLETRGCIGAFERLPLSVKIILLVLFSTIGFAALSAFSIVISAYSLQTSSAARTFVSHGKLISGVLQALQRERRAGRIMLQGNGTDQQIEYLKSISNTESAFASMTAELNENKDNLYGDLYTTFLSQRTLLDSIRAKSTSKTTSVLEMLESYQKVTRATLNLLHRSNAVLEYSFDTSSVGVYSEYTESSLVMLIISTVLVRDASLRASMLPILEKVSGEREIAEFILVNSGPAASVAKFTQLILQSSAKSRFDEIVKEVIAKPGNYSFDVATFDKDVLAMAQLFAAVGDGVFSGDIQQFAETSIHQSIGIIVGVLAIVVFFAITSVSNSILFAMSIIGPWKRLNAVQEATISKFVPKGFLSLMGWKSISQAALGKFQEKEVTILIVRIANYSKLESAYKESPGQLYDFVNTFLAYVGPYIRNNSGYIDKFNSNHFVAIFQKDKKGIKAALEIQQSMANFNKMQNSFSVVVRMSLVSGKLVIGTIGENERMESTSLSGVMKLAMKLQKIAKRANASIITTRDSLSKLQNPKAIHQRYLGVVKLNSEMLGSCELYEILTFTEPAKVKTKDHFSKAVRCLQTGRFSESLSVFESIAQTNQSDTLAARYRDLTKQCISENVKRLSELSVSSVLQIPNLRDALEQLCIQEHSSENFNLWLQIQSYKECQSAEERKILAAKISEEYLQLDGKQPVNLSAEQVSAVKRAVQSNNSLLSPLLFVELESQIEHLMMDTVKRLKNLQHFKLEFFKSSLAFKPEEIELR